MINKIVLYFLAVLLQHTYSHSITSNANMNLPVETKNLYVPNLTEVAEGRFLISRVVQCYICVICILVLNEGLQKNFENITVDVIDCPDLTQEPFTLACRGERRIWKSLQITIIKLLLINRLRRKTNFSRNRWTTIPFATCTKN